MVRGRRGGGGLGAFNLLQDLERRQAGHLPPHRFREQLTALTFRYHRHKFRIPRDPAGPDLIFVSPETQCSGSQIFSSEN